jgi:hypothetical protein
MGQQPSMYHGRLVGGEVVADDVNVQTGLSLAAGLVEEVAEVNCGLVRSLSPRHAAGTVSARAFPCVRTQAADRARAT